MKRLQKNRLLQLVLHLGREKITLEADIELFILKNGLVTYADIVNRTNIPDEYITQAMRNLLNDGKIFQCKGDAYSAGGRMLYYLSSVFYVLSVVVYYWVKKDR